MRGDVSREIRCVLKSHGFNLTPLSKMRFLEYTAPEQVSTYIGHELITYFLLCLSLFIQTLCSAFSSKVNFFLVICHCSRRFHPMSIYQGRQV